jgi:septum formation protein
MEDKRNNQASEPGHGSWSESQRDHSSSSELPKIVLASSSPRRAAILRTVNWPFEMLPPDVDETLKSGEDAATYVQRLALAKAEVAVRGSQGSMIVAADTTVVIGEQILGKPCDHDDARDMLRKLSGQWHRVLTGVAVIKGDTSEAKVAYQTTEVKFALMSAEEIDWYVSTDEPMDKAGAYAIQGLGSRFIEGIRGDYFNVMGLPVRLLYELSLG